MGMWSDLALWVTDQLNAESRSFDREFGTATSWYDLGNYEPTPPSIVAAILAQLPDSADHYSFVDLGSGKGRVVLIAAAHPFTEVLGVERRRALVWRSRRNRSVYSGPIAIEPRFVCSDVRAATFPDGPLLLFLYNPFGPDILAEVLDNIGPRELLIAAVNPPPDPFFEERGFSLVHREPHESDDRRWVLLRR